jgi:hypothetical protein
MRLAELYNRAIDWPNQTGIVVTLAVATLLVIVGLVLASKKWVWLGRGLGLLGFCTIMAALFILQAQTITEKQGENITIVRFKYPERTRRPLLLLLGGLPCTAVAVMWLGFVKTRYRLQREAPGHLKAGRRYFAQKEYESALAEYNRAIHTAPQLAEAYCRRGFVYQAMGQTEQARSDYDQAILCDPRLALAYLQRGKMLTDSGDLDEALADFGQLMLIQANDPDTYLHRGICLVKKGLLSEALADFHRVLKLTNHSDFAEPAKTYIRQLEERASASLPSSGNGESALPGSPRPRAQDHAI